MLGTNGDRPLLFIFFVYNKISFFRADTWPATTFLVNPYCRVCNKFFFGRIQYAPTNPTSHITPLTFILQIPVSLLLSCLKFVPQSLYRELLLLLLCQYLQGLLLFLKLVLQALDLMHWLVHQNILF